MTQGFPGLDILRLRTAIAADARNAVGTGSTGPEERQDAYALRLFPESQDARQRAAMADSMYSCVLSYLAALRSADVDAPELHEAYSIHVGMAPAWLCAIAQRYSAYRDLSTSKGLGDWAPGPGDALVVSGPVHCVVLTDPIEGDWLTSEGGQPETGTHADGTGLERGMAIHSRRMRLRIVDGRLQTGTVRADGSVTWGRFALYAVDCSVLRRVSDA